VSEYDGKQVVGIDVHRHRSVIVRQTVAGEQLLGGEGQCARGAGASRACTSRSPTCSGFVAGCCWRTPRWIVRIGPGNSLCRVIEVFDFEIDTVGRQKPAPSPEGHTHSHRARHPPAPPARGDPHTMATQLGVLNPAQQLYRIPEAMQLLAMSRSVMYEQLRANRLRSVKQRRTRLIPVSAIREYVELLEKEAEVNHDQAA
jgi:excisionase family DNA binding protein